MTFHETYYPLSPPGNTNTIQYLIPGSATNVELLKQVKNWQSPLRDPWSNCLINSLETTFFVLETIRTGAMRVIHIPVKTEEMQTLRIKFVLYCPICALNLKIKRANFCRN